ncbi:cation:proton antiporter [Aneurinibacillus terranovensis]|uniref:cation:proton antiporter n=1 Tax=Aneurinibacillus terranovensis TaxID=278991 RepID=UPI000429DE0D|nr:cation:proton antiporter [Aneurinibacillus terranovensis]
MDSLLPLFWILFLSFLFQMLTTKLPWLRIPSVIAYILFGMIIGNGEFRLFQPQNLQWLNGISQFGLLYLLFLSGMEVDIRIFKRTRLPGEHAAADYPNPLFLGLVLFLCTLVLSYVLSVMMKSLDSTIQPWMMMLVLSTTSLGIVLPVLKELDLQRTRYGQSILVAALLADLITMLFISIVADMYQMGFTWRKLSVGLLLPFIMLSYVAISRFQRTRIWRDWFRSDSIAKMQAVFALLGLFGVITDFTGSEPMLGSFLAGILLSFFQMNENNRLRQQLESVGYSFIIPIFFVMVGFHFHLGTLENSPNVWVWIPFLLLSAYAVKVLPMLWFARSFGSRAVLAGGFLLSSRMTLVIVASSIGVHLGTIPPEIDQALLVVAIITSTLSPILFTMVYRRGPTKS